MIVRCEHGARPENNLQFAPACTCQRTNLLSQHGSRGVPQQTSVWYNTIIACKFQCSLLNPEAVSPCCPGIIRRTRRMWKVAVSIRDLLHGGDHHTDLRLNLKSIGKTTCLFLSPPFICEVPLPLFLLSVRVKHHRRRENNDGWGVCMTGRVRCSSRRENVSPPPLPVQ